MRLSVQRRPCGASRHAIFFALYPPVERAAEIAHFTDQMFESGRLRGPRVARERLHISLNSLGIYEAPPSGLIDDVRKAVSAVKVRPFTVALDRLKSFRNSKSLRPRVLSGEDGLIGIDLLSAALYRTLRSAGLTCSHRRLTPHLTLSREENELPEDFIEPVSWRVEDFRLIHSPRGEGRHNVLGCWRLME